MSHTDAQYSFQEISPPQQFQLVTKANPAHYHIPINDLFDFSPKIKPEKSEVFSRTLPWLSMVPAREGSIRRNIVPRGFTTQYTP